MNRYLVLVLGITIALLLVRYRVAVKHFIGDVGFAEKIFGKGGTHTFILVLALLSFFGSLMYFLGTFQSLLKDYLGPFFGVK